MIDHAIRKQLATIIRSYLAEEITAFELDDVLQSLEGQTDDATAQDILVQLWFFYDDLKDHKIVATKESWDCLYRFLLILESEGELETIKTRHWSLWQPVAACAVAMFMFIVFQIGWSQLLLFISWPFGVVSILISFWKSRIPSPSSQRELATIPFSSVSEILAVRRQTPAFSKTPYPEQLKERRVRGRVTAKAMWIPAILMWITFAPIILCFQVMPETKTRFRVRLSQQDEYTKTQNASERKPACNPVPR
jgi:hypothetical protein